MERVASAKEVSGVELAVKELKKAVANVGETMANVGDKVAKVGDKVANVGELLAKKGEMEKVTIARAKEVSRVKLVEKLKEAVATRHVGELKELLGKKKFELSGEELDELLLQLPEQLLTNVKEELGQDLDKLLSPKALLCRAAAADLRPPESLLTCTCRGSAFAAAALEAARLNHHRLFGIFFDRSCQSVNWDPGSALPLLYDAWLAEGARSEALNGTNAKDKKVHVAFLHFAVKTRNEAVVDHLLFVYGGSLADEVCLGDTTCTTALHRGCHYGHLSIVRLMLNTVPRDPHVWRLDHRGRNALHFAASQGHPEVVKLLLEHIPDAERRAKLVNMFDSQGMAPLHLAAACSSRSPAMYGQVARLLLKDGGADPALVSPAKSGSSVAVFLETYLPIQRTPPRRTGEHLTPLYDECLRLNPITSSFVSPGGFTPLHFALAYVGKPDDTNTARSMPAFRSVTDDRTSENTDTSVPVTMVVINHLIDNKMENTLTITDAQGLTAYDWAEAAGVEDYYFGDGRCPGVDLSQKCESARDRARALYEECMELEKMKAELVWVDKMGLALRNGRWCVAKMLANVAKQKGMVIGSASWDHLKWAASKPEAAIEDAWKVEGRDCLKDPWHVWNGRVEEVVLPMVQSGVMSDRVVLQRCLMWAMKKQMVALSMTVASHEDCELLEVTRGCKPGLTPLERAAEWSNVPWGQWGPGLRPVLQVMEQRDVVRNRMYGDRQLYVDYLNGLLVASVLMAGLAVSSYQQAPKVLDALGDATADKQMRMLARHFVWFNHVTFFLAMAATFAGIAGAIPSPSGQLAYSMKKIRYAATLATLLLVGAVVFLTASFAVAGLGLFNLASHQRLQINQFSIVFGSVSALLLVWLVHHLVQLWDVIHHFLNYWAYEPTSAKEDAPWKHVVRIIAIFCIKVYLLYFNRFLIVPRYRERVRKWLLRFADTLYGGDSQVLLLRQR